MNEFNLQCKAICLLDSFISTFVGSFHFTYLICISKYYKEKKCTQVESSSSLSLRQTILKCTSAQFRQAVVYQLHLGLLHLAPNWKHAWFMKLFPNSSSLKKIPLGRSKVKVSIIYVLFLHKLDTCKKFEFMTF